MSHGAVQSSPAGAAPPLPRAAEGPSRRERAVRLGLPPALYLAAVVAVYLAYPWQRFVEWMGFLNGYLVLPLGREFTIPIMLARGFSPAEAIFLVVFVDFIAGSFLAWNLDLSRRLAYLGPYVERLERKASIFGHDHPSVRALGIVGLFLWSVKPGRGSGGATSAVLGKAVFLQTRWLLPTITGGSLVGCSLVALAAWSALSLPALSVAAVGAALLSTLALFGLWRGRAAVAQWLGLTGRARVTSDDR
jgi:uncharacterized membrane protein